MLGALMAGADGGAAFGDWPTIGGEWLPQTAFSLEPWWRNFTEHHASQQLMHRTLGYIMVGLALALALCARMRGDGLVCSLALRLAAVAVLQAGLGVATILFGPQFWWWASVHQLTAVALWGLAVLVVRGIIIPQT
jgi:cytochrome c oxidase assembly protein subunit 15